MAKVGIHGGAGVLHDLKVSGGHPGQFITLTRQEARDIDTADAEGMALLMEALDYAQGEDDPQARYVIIYVEPGEL